MRYAIFSNSSCPILNISSIGYAFDSKVTQFGPGVRNSYIIHYVISGSGYFNGVRVCEGEGFLIKPGMKEHYFPDENDPWEFLWVISEDPAMQRLFEAFECEGCRNTFRYDNILEIKSLTALLKEKINCSISGIEMLEIFLKIIKNQQRKTAFADGKSNSDVYVEAAQSFIRANMHRSLSVSHLTDFLGISQPYLFGIFRKRFSLSPKQYILEQKIELSKKLLAETDASVSSIANSVGYSDALSFSKLFKAKVGLSPQGYRVKYKFY